MLNYSSSLRYSSTGKKRKTKSLSRAKKITPKFVERTSNDNIYRRDNASHYPSVAVDSSPESCAKKESMKYTGTLVKGIATMHKSNAVPVIDEQQAKELASMRR